MQSKIKISLRFKFLICYLLLVVLTVGLLNTYGHKLMYQRLLDNAETSIYNEAEEIKSQYLANAYSGCIMYCTELFSDRCYRTFNQICIGKIL